MTTEPIRMTISAFIDLCKRVSEESVTTNEITELYVDEDGNRTYLGTLSAKWQSEFMTITDAEFYSLVERDRFTRDDYNHVEYAEPLTFVPTPVVIDDDGEEMSDESMRELFEFHASMFNRSMVYDHSTMPDEPTI